MNQFCEQLEDYFDGELDPNATEAFELHLQGCLQCQAELVELKQLDGSVREAWLQVDIASRHLNLDATVETHRPWLGIGTLVAMAALLMVGLTMAIVFTNGETPAVSETNESSPSVAPLDDRMAVDESQTPTFQTVHARASFGDGHAKHRYESTDEFTYVEVVPRL